MKEEYLTEIAKTIKRGRLNQDDDENITIDIYDATNKKLAFAIFSPNDGPNKTPLLFQLKFIREYLPALS